MVKVERPSRRDAMTLLVGGLAACLGDEASAGDGITVGEDPPGTPPPPPIDRRTKRSKMPRLDHPPAPDIPKRARRLRRIGPEGSRPGNTGTSRVPD